APVQRPLRHIPWSYQLGVPWRLLISLVSGFLVAVVASGTHRMGAEENIPYGLLLSFVLVGMSAWAARSRSGVVGAAFHLIASSAMAWLMAFPGPGGDVLVPVGGKGVFLSFFGLHAGYIWLFGLIVLQLAMMVLPGRWFLVEGSEQAKGTVSSERKQHVPESDGAHMGSVAPDTAGSDSVASGSAASADVVRDGVPDHQEPSS
ncbi:MAG: hypothetical protein LKK28_08245, partial [Bifidobacterium crudilactis]|nr:hypothetical protein [Bifidobacterium crudilactis]